MEMIINTVNIDGNNIQVGKDYSIGQIASNEPKFICPRCNQEFITGDIVIFNLESPETLHTTCL